MEIGIDDLTFEEDDYGIQNNPNDGSVYTPDFDSLTQEKPWMGDVVTTSPQSTQVSTSTEPVKQQDEDDIIVSLLKSKGIEDPSKLKFENDEGVIEEVDWSTLSNEEKLNILNSDDSEIEYDLNDEEESFLNYCRDNGISPSEYIEYQKQLALEDYRQALEGNPRYEIDALSNDELYVLDLQARVKDITEEEATAALEQEKTNAALFEKKMAGIREEYKAVEDEKVQQEQILTQQEQQELFQQFQDGVLQAIDSLNDVGGVELNLEDDDIDELANFILSSDAAGVSYLGKALDDPETLVKMAWFALKGDEALESITDYYNKEITKQSRDAYNAGYEDAKKGVQPRSSKPRVVTKPTPKPGEEITPVSTGKTIDDIDF